MPRLMHRRNDSDEAELLNLMSQFCNRPYGIHTVTVQTSLCVSALGCNRTLRGQLVTCSQVTCTSSERRHKSTATCAVVPLVSITAWIHRKELFEKLLRSICILGRRSQFNSLSSLTNPAAQRAHTSRERQGLNGSTSPNSSVLHYL